MYTQSFSYVPFFVTSWNVAHPAPLSMEFSRQEYCSGLQFPPPGDLPDPGIEPISFASPALTGILYHCATWEALFLNHGGYLILDSTFYHFKYFSTFIDSTFIKKSLSFLKFCVTT